MENSDLEYIPRTFEPAFVQDLLGLYFGRDCVMT